MGKFIDRHRNKRHAERMSDPHGWADKMEDEAGARSVLPFILLVAVVVLSFCVWFLWNLANDLQFRIETIEGFLMEQPPSGPQ